MHISHCVNKLPVAGCHSNAFINPFGKQVQMPISIGEYWFFFQFCGLFFPLNWGFSGDVQIEFFQLMCAVLETDHTCR